MRGHAPPPLSDKDAGILKRVFVQRFEGDTELHEIAMQMFFESEDRWIVGNGFNVSAWTSKADGFREAAIEARELERRRDQLGREDPAESMSEESRALLEGVMGGSRGG